MASHGTLTHIPGPPALPVIGHTVQIARDSYGTQQRWMRRYGNVYKTHMLGRWRVNLCGPDALEMVLLDRQKIFSSKGGWDALERLYPGGLLLQDFDEHRASRRIMTAAFRAGAMADYRSRMTEAMEQLLTTWPEGTPFRFYDAAKELTLRMGGAVFMGLPLNGALAKQLNAAIRDEIRAALAVIRTPVPGTAMWRGVRGRRFLLETFRALIPERRRTGGNDFFSQMCLARDEDGAAWGEAELLDQFNLLIMAAHDTTATTLTAMMAALAQNPAWQDKLADEVAGLGDGPLDDAALARMTETDKVMKEALRLITPVPFIPRLALEPFTFDGIEIPAGTSIALNPGVTMRSPSLYTDPLSFDPDRFSPERAEDKRHKFAWTPFGGGAHKCLGMHFASMQVKIFIATLLRHRRVSLAGRATPHWSMMPIPRPTCGLPAVLSAR